MKNRICAADLTDEDVLKEFIKRFECDGAILIYRDSEIENGFGRWRNANGRKWVNSVFNMLKKGQSLNIDETNFKEGLTVQLSQN